MEGEKTIRVTFEFESNAGEEVGRITGRLTEMDTQASEAFRRMTEGSTLSARGIGEQAEALSRLPGPLGTAAGGFKRLLTAAKSFIATPVGAVLAALALALKSLTAWFHSSAEGELEFARVSGYLGGILGQLKEVAIAVGKAIYKAFSDPKEAVKSLWESIKQNLVNRLEGLGEVFRAVGKIVTSGFTEGFEDLKTAALKATTGVEDLAGKVGAYAVKVQSAAKATSELKVAEAQLARERSNWQERSAELDVEMEQLRTRMYAASDAERLKLAEKYRAVVSEKYAKEKEFLEEELRIKKELNALTTNSQSDYDEVNRLNAAIIRLKAEEQQALRPVERQVGGISRRGESVRESVERESREALAAQEEYRRKWEAAQLDFAERQLDLMDESFYKRQRENELQHQKALADIARQEEELLSAKRKAYGGEATLTASETEHFARLREAAAQEAGKRSRELSEAIEAAFAESRLRFADELTVQLSDIEGYYSERLRQATGNEALIAELRMAKEKEISLAHNRYSREMLKNDLEVTRKRLENARAYYKTEADRREADLKAQKAAKEKVIALLESQMATAPAEELRKEIALAREELEAFNRELERIPKDRVRETASAFGEILGSLGNLDGELGEVFRSLSSGFDSVTKTLSSDMETMEGKAGAVSTIISGTVALINMVISATNARKAAEKEFYKNSIAFAHEYALALNEQLRLQHAGGKFVTDYAGQINDSFGALEDAMLKYREALDKLSGGKAKVDLRNAVDWKNTLKGAATGAAVGAAVGSIVPVIGTAVGAVVGAVGGFFAGLFGGKKKKDVETDLLTVFPELVDAAGNLNRELAQALVATDQVDDATKQLLENALEWAEAIDAAKESIREVTTDLAGDLGNNLRNALVEAWKAGEDASASMFDAASSSLEGFITQLLYSTIFSDIFEEFSDRLAESLVPTGDGDVLDDYEWLMEQMQAKDALYVDSLEQIKRRAQQMGFWGFGASEDGTAAAAGRKATSKGITAVSQESVDELNGRLTAGLIYLDGISLTVGGINKQLTAGVSLLREITENTRHCERLEAMAEDLRSMKADIGSMNTRGVAVRV